MVDQSQTEPNLLIEEIRKKQGKVSPWILPVVLLAMLLLCIVLSLSPPSRNALWMEERTMKGEKTAPRLLPLSATTLYTNAFVLTEPGLGGYSDLFLCTTAVLTQTCSNLTQTPSINEYWPVSSVSADTIAYYGIGENTIDIFTLELPAGSPKPITVRAGVSGLYTAYAVTTTQALAFSPDGRWVAFPAAAKKGKSIELFIARNDGLYVDHIEDRDLLFDYILRDYAWMDTQTLVLGVERADGTLKQWLVKVDNVKGALGLESLQSVKP